MCGEGRGGVCIETEGSGGLVVSSNEMEEEEDNGMVGWGEGGVAAEGKCQC